MFTEVTAARPDGLPLPTHAPDGWVHLSVAIARVAATILGEKWTDLFEPCLSIGQPTPEPANEDERYAERLALYMAEQFVDACRFDHLITGYRRVDGAGPVAPMPADWWETENRCLRFRTWSVDPDDIVSDRLDLPCWIWVDDASLTRLLDRIWRHDAGIRTVIFAELGQLVGAREALTILQPHLAADDAASVLLGTPPGGKELIELCLTGAVGSIASRMERRRDADRRGRGGKLVEAVNNWPVPAETWAGVELSPVQDWSESDFVTKRDARSSIKLERVSFDRFDLLKYLESIGKLWRYQLLVQGSDTVVEEGYTLAEAGPQVEQHAVVVPFRSPDIVAAPAAGDVPALAARSAQSAKRKGTSPGPQLDGEWRYKVFQYCQKIGRGAVESQAISQRVFLINVREHYGLRQDQGPKDARRTNIWRMAWLDEQAGVGEE